MERILIEYLANAFWQLPLLAGGAWLLLHVTRPSAAAQHRVWLGVLGIGLLLPLHGAGRGGAVAGLGATAGAGARANGWAGAQAGAFDRGGSFDSGGSSLNTIYAGLNTVSGAGLEGPSAGAGPESVRQSPVIETGLAMAAKLESVGRVRTVSLAAGAARWIVGLYLAVAAFGIFRIVLAWRAARRLVANSREIALSGRLSAAVAECSRRLGVSVPEVRESSETGGPVVVGAARPVLLWPESFSHWDDDEVVAALCHEMAHIRRRDYAMNLLCEAAAVPLRWHPVTFGVARRIRCTREMACDAMAAAAMESKATYAKCLLSLAQSMVRELAGPAVVSISGCAAAGLFNGNALEERMMRLMRGDARMSWQARAARGLAGAAAMIAAIGLAAGFHVVPAMAQGHAPAAVAEQSAAAGRKVQSGVHGGVQDGVVSPEVKVKPVAPVVKVAPAVRVRPLVQLATVSPVVKVAMVSPVIDVMPEVQVAPKVQLTPVSPAKPKGSVGNAKCPGHRMHAIVDGQERELTPEEQRRMEKQLAEAQQQIAAATAKINSPEFRKEIEEAQREAAAAAAKVDSGEFQKQMANAQKQVAEATAKLNSPEFKRQIEDAGKAVNSAEFQQDMVKARQQVAEATAKLNSPEFRQQIEKAQHEAAEAAAKVDGGEFQKQMADAEKQIADAMAQMKAEQKDSNK